MKNYLRTFKLIKEYPESMKVGAVAIQKGDKYMMSGETQYSSFQTGKLVDSNVIENHPEFWKEVSEPLFQTDDNVDIFQNDSYYIVNKVSFNSALATATINSRKNEDYCYFKSKEKLNKWLVDEKPLVSLNEIVQIVDSTNEVLTVLGLLVKIEELAKSKVK